MTSKSSSSSSASEKRNTVMDLLVNEAIVNKSKWAMETLNAMRQVSRSDRNRYLTAVAEGVDVAKYDAIDTAFRTLWSDGSKVTENVFDKLPTLFKTQSDGTHMMRRFRLTKDTDLIFTARRFLKGHAPFKDMSEDSKSWEDPHNHKRTTQRSFFTGEYRVRVKNGNDIMNVRFFVDNHIFITREAITNKYRLHRVVIDKNMERHLTEKTMGAFKTYIDDTITITNIALNLLHPSFLSRSTKINIHDILHEYVVDDPKLESELQDYAIKQWKRAIPEFKHKMNLVYDVRQEYEPEDTYTKGKRLMWD